MTIFWQEKARPPETNGTPAECAPRDETQGCRRSDSEEYPAGPYSTFDGERLTVQKSKWRGETGSRVVVCQVFFSLATSSTVANDDGMLRRLPRSESRPLHKLQGQSDSHKFRVSDTVLS